MTKETELPKPGEVEKLSAVIDRGRNLLNGAEIFTGLVTMWLSQVRLLLREIYGSNSDAERHWPNVQPTSITKDQARELLRVNLDKAERLHTALTDAAIKALAGPHGRVFVGHGRSLVWHVLKDFLQDTLGLPCEEFNRESAAGIATTERLEQMLGVSAFAFLIMTAEDQHIDETLHARENVVHEVGLFQGRLGPRRAIVLLEEGCREFSNIRGLTHIPFPPGRIKAAFEDIRKVLVREGVTGT